MATEDMVLVKFSAHSFGYYTYIPRELLLVCLLILLHKVCHVICDVLSEDVLSVDVQVWSPTQFYSVDFSKSRIGVNKCVFNKRTIKVCGSCC